jgi:hypothetical protein
MAHVTSELKRGLDRTIGAVWIYPSFGYWCLKGMNGEILAEISGSNTSDIWTYKGKKYHELKNAKDAAMRHLRAV